MNAFWSDLKYGIRMMRKSPGVTLVAIAAMALGIGANTTMFSAMDALILRPFNFAHQDRLAAVWEQNLKVGIIRGSVSPGNFSDWLEQSQTFDRMVAVEQRSFRRTDGDLPESWDGYAVSPEFFETLGVTAALGRAFEAGDGLPGSDPIVVLKHSLWQNRFAGDPNVLGKTVILNGKAFTIAGVMGAEFNYPFKMGELWTPLIFSAEERANHGSHYLNVFGRLKPGVTLDQADADIKQIAARLEDLYPNANSGRSAWVLSLNKDAVRGAGMFLPIAMGAVGFLLLIACANVANILLARAAGRQREIAVRLAVGASRWHIVRQLLIESVVLSMVGGALGFLLAVWCADSLSASIPEDFTRFIPGWGHMNINRVVLGFTLVTSLLTGLLFGLLPAWHSSRISFVEALKEGGRGLVGHRASKRWRNTLVVAEVALSLVLLTGAGLMTRSFVEILRTDWGFNPEHALTMEIALQPREYAEPARRIDFFERLVAGVEALPGVERAGVTGVLPMTGNNQSQTFQIIGDPPFERGRQPFTSLRVVSPGYFRAIGTPLRNGRLLDERDGTRSEPVAVVDEAFVRRFMPGREIVGSRIKLTGSNAETEIVGVVAEVMNDDLENVRRPTVYLPFAQAPGLSQVLVIRAEGDLSQLAAAVRQTVTAMDSTQPVARIKTLSDLVKERSAPKRVATWSMGVFAVLALMLSAVGIYAVMSYLVASRTHELGLRIALGARRWHVFKLIVGHGLLLAGIGIAIGVAGSLALTRLMAPMLFGVGPTDAATFCGVSLLFAVIAGLACHVPGQRAMRVDPIVALRYE
jgi:putative ABC transport system permease protein